MNSLARVCSDLVAGSIVIVELAVAAPADRGSTDKWGHFRRSELPMLRSPKLQL